MLPRSVLHDWLSNNGLDVHRWHRKYLVSFFWQILRRYLRPLESGQLRLEFNDVLQMPNAQRKPWVGWVEIVAGLRSR
jgi:hypothetical protein